MHFTIVWEAHGNATEKAGIPVLQTLLGMHDARLAGARSVSVCWWFLVIVGFPKVITDSNLFGQLSPHFQNTEDGSRGVRGFFRSGRVHII